MRIRRPISFSKFYKMKNSGFSLLEALISMVIMAGALVLLSNAWGGAFRSIKKGKQQYEVSILLERKLTEVDLEFRGKPLTEIPDEREEDLGKDYPNIRWKLTSKKFEFPDITGMLKQRDQGSDSTSEMIFKQLTEMINKAIKEVKVSIKVKEGTKTREYSAVTYFIDYSQTDIPGVGGLGGGAGFPGGGALGPGTGTDSGGSGSGFGGGGQ